MIETGISYIELLENGIIKVETKKDVLATEEGLNENYNAYKQLLGNEKGLFLVILHPLGESDETAKAKFVDKNRAKIKKAEALVVKALAHRIEMNFYKNVQKPDHPVHVFKDEKEAVHWLLSFKNN